MSEEKEESSVLRLLAEGLKQQVLSGVSLYVERLVKRILRLVALTIAGVTIALFGIAFFAVGIAKWLATMMAAWLAWLIVGVVLFLIGIILALVTFAASRSSKS